MVPTIENEGAPSIMFVGECNPYGMLPGYALHYLPRTAAGNRLRKILGLRDATYVNMLVKTNLCVGRFSVAAAKANAQHLLTDPFPKILVLLGERVKAAFGLHDCPFFTTSQIFPAGHVEGRILIYLPHPSGRCRSWSNENNVALARSMLRKHAPEIPWGEI
jgi:hypothetical protein